MTSFDGVEKLLKMYAKKKQDFLSYRPIIFDIQKLPDQRILKTLFRKNKIRYVFDYITEQRQELKTIRRPNSIDMVIKKNKNMRMGKWAYFPWRFALVHIFNKKFFDEVRLSRNRNLITTAEQQRFANLRIGIAGLNVGYSAALCLALEGGCRKMKFAENDFLSLSNLNRFRGSICDLHLNKAIITARQIYEIDPYIQINVWDQGILENNIKKFLLHPKIDILIEEMDHLPLKISMRKFARKLRIPVIMVTGNAENVIIDIERFDLDPQLSLLNKKLKPKIIKSIEEMQNIEKISIKDKALLCRDFIGSKYLTQRLRQSFIQIGSELAGIPQLAESSFLRGAVICYLVRQIAIGTRVPSGRYKVQLQSIFQ